MGTIQLAKHRLHAEKKKGGVAFDAAGICHMEVTLETLSASVVTLHGKKTMTKIKFKLDKSGERVCSAKCGFHKAVPSSDMYECVVANPSRLIRENMPCLPGIIQQRDEALLEVKQLNEILEGCPGCTAAEQGIEVVMEERDESRATAARFMEDADRWKSIIMATREWLRKLGPLEGETDGRKWNKHVVSHELEELREILSEGGD